MSDEGADLLPRLFADRNAAHSVALAGTGLLLVASMVQLGASTVTTCDVLAVVP